MGAVVASYISQSMKPEVGSSSTAPRGDYDHLLNTFLWMWEATLNSLTSMVNTYLNGPVTILCTCLDHIIKVIGDSVSLYLQVFQHCWDKVMDAAILPWITLVVGITFVGTALVVYVVRKGARCVFPHVNSSSASGFY